MAIDVELAHRAAGFVVLSMAKGGYDPDRQYSVGTEDRKLKGALKAWYELTDGQVAARLKERLIRCECAERRKSRWHFMKDCWMCSAKGWRTIMEKEKKHVRWWLEQRASDAEKKASGEGCCADYVVESTDRMERFGYWQAPLVTDGYVVQNWKSKPKPALMTVTFPVKMANSKGEIVDVVEKTVEIAAPEDACYDAWKVLRLVLGSRRKELTAALSSLDGQREQEAKRDVWLISTLQTRLTTRGHARGYEDEVKDLLTGDQFGRVRPLWKGIR